MASLKESIASIKSLVDAGIMSEAEFEEQKDRYLADAYEEADGLLAKGDKDSLLKAQETYRELGDHLDAKSKAKLCTEKLSKLDKAEAAAQKKRKKIIAIALSLAVVIIGAFIAIWTATAQTRAVHAIRSAKVGGIITLGSYEQDNDTGNGKEAIKWRVLAKSGNRMLVISVKALDCKQFNSSKDRGNDWGSSDLKKWLTGTFKTTAFSADELQMVSEVTCLTVDEANQYFKSSSDRKCFPTAYAKAQRTSVLSWKSGECDWWLRSPGRGSDDAAFVSSGGGVNSSGYYVNKVDVAVRPALWITLS